MGGLGVPAQDDDDDEDLGAGEQRHHRAVRPVPVEQRAHHEQAADAAEQRRRREQPGRPAAVAGREQLGAVDGEGRVGDAAERAGEEHRQPHHRPADGVGQRRSSAVASGSPVAISRLRPRTSAMRPPRIRPMPAGVAVPIVKIAIVVAREAADVLQVAVLEQAGRGDEEVRQQGDDGEHGEPAPVERRGDDVRALESRGLGQPAGDVDGDDEPHQRDEVDEPPRARRRCRRAAGPSRRRRRRARWPSPAR